MSKNTGSFLILLFNLTVEGDTVANHIMSSLPHLLKPLSVVCALSATKMEAQTQFAIEVAPEAKVIFVRH